MNHLKDEIDNIINSHAHQMGWYMDGIKSDLAKFFESEMLSIIPELRKHESNCEADDRYCDCGATPYNQARVDIRNALKGRLGK